MITNSRSCHLFEYLSVQPLFQSDGAKRIIFHHITAAHLCAVTYMTEISLIVTLNNQFTLPYLHHITVVLQYCWDRTIARSGDMYEDGSETLSLIILFKCFGITNTSVENFAVRISSLKTVPKFLQKLNELSTILTYNVHVSSILMSPLRARVSCQKLQNYGDIVSNPSFSAVTCVIRRCTLC